MYRNHDARRGYNDECRAGGIVPQHAAGLRAVSEPLRSASRNDTVIPLVDLQAQHERIRGEVEAAALRVLRSGRYASGPEVEAFEQEFARHCGTEHAVGVNSGTSALFIALTAAGIGAGDEVITVPFTFVATVDAICRTGADVRFVDVQPESLTMDPAALERAVTPRTRAIVPVHLYGQPADMDPILDLARRRRIVVVEDAAQAHGARYGGRRAGCIGDAGCFSFYPTKNLSAAGEAGIIVTDDAGQARIARRLRSWGTADAGGRAVAGGNYRMDELQAAVLRVKLPHLDAWTRARQAVAGRYDALLGESVATPAVTPGTEHAWNVYAIRAPRRDAVRASLQAAHVECAVHYAAPVHLQAPYAGAGYGAGAFPQAERAAREVLSLPIYPELSEAQQLEVVNAVLRAAGAGS